MNTPAVIETDRELDRKHIVLGNSPLILDKRHYKWDDLHW